MGMSYPLSPTYLGGKIRNIYTFRPTPSGAYIYGQSGILLRGVTWAEIEGPFIHYYGGP